MIMAISGAATYKHSHMDRYIQQVELFINLGRFIQLNIFIKLGMLIKMKMFVMLKTFKFTMFIKL